MKDEEIIRQVLEGDRELFGLLIRKYQKAIYSLAYSRTGSPEEAQDITQEVFLEAFDRLPSLRSPSKFCGWLRSIARNLTVHHLKRRLRYKAAHRTVEEMAGEYSSGESFSLRDAVLKLIDSLSEPNRIVVTLRFIAGLSSKEVADFLGISVSAVDVRVHRSIKALRRNALSAIQEGMRYEEVSENLTPNLLRRIRERHNMPFLSVNLGERRPVYLDYLHRVISQSRGRIWEEDDMSLIACYGMPIRYEDDLDRAVDTALRIREELESPDLRISVSMVGVELDEKGEMRISEKAIRRMNSLSSSPPGVVLADEMIYTLLSDRYAFEEIQLGGGITAYQLLGRSFSSRGERRSPMVGRCEELESLRGMVEELLIGESGLVNLIGEAGIGKSRLIRELRAACADDGIIWLEGKCMPRSPLPYLPIVQMLMGYFGINEGMKNDKRRDLVESALRRLDMEQALPYICDFLGIKDDFGDEGYERATAEQIRYRTYTFLRDLFTRVSEERPLILVIEDMHWLDESSWELLEYLTCLMDRGDVLILCVQRPNPRGIWERMEEKVSGMKGCRYRRMWLSGLSMRQSRLLIEHSFQSTGIPYEEDVADQICERARGNPFYMEEMLRSYARGGGDVGEIPYRIGSVILSRLDMLDELSRNIVQYASAFSDSIDLAVLRRIFREGDVDEVIERLKRCDFLRTEGGRVLFSHDLLHETIYGDIAPSGRMDIHLDIGKAMEELRSEDLERVYEQLAYHYSRSRDRMKGLEYLMKAGDKLKSAYENEMAIDFYRRALEVAGEIGDGANPQKVEIYESLGMIYDLMGRKRDAQESYLNALKCCSDRRKRSRLYLRLERSAVDKELKDHYLNLARQTLGDDPDSPEIALIYRAQAWRCWNEPGGDDAAHALELAQRGLDLVKDTDNFEEIVQLCQAANWFSIFVTDSEEMPMMYARIAYDAAKRSGDRRLMGIAALLFQKASEWGDESVLLENIEINRMIGDQKELVASYAYLHFHYVGCEKWERAVQALREGIAISREMEDREGGSSEGWLKWCLYGVGRVYAQSGDPEMAERWCRELLNEHRCKDIPHDLFYLNAVMAEAHYHRGEMERARKFVSKAMESLKGIDRDKVADRWYAKQWFWLMMTRWADNRIFPEENLMIARAVMIKQRPIPRGDQALGKIYLMLGEYERSLEHFMRGYVYPPRNPRGWQFLIELARRAPHLEGWRRFLNHLGGRSGNDPEIQEQFHRLLTVWEQFYAAQLSGAIKQGDKHQGSSV